MNIPTAMQNLMGQANKEYMRGDHQQAIKICKRIIQEHPQCFKPYETLSEIYSEVARMGGSKFVDAFTSKKMLMCINVIESF